MSIAQDGRALLHQISIANADLKSFFEWANKAADQYQRSVACTPTFIPYVATIHRTLVTFLALRRRYTDLLWPFRVAYEAMKGNVSDALDDFFLAHLEPLAVLWNTFLSLDCQIDTRVLDPKHLLSVATHVAELQSWLDALSKEIETTRTYARAVYPDMQSFTLSRLLQASQNVHQPAGMQTDAVAELVHAVRTWNSTIWTDRGLSRLPSPERVAIKTIDELIDSHKVAGLGDAGRKGVDGGK